jgi:putative Mn2+ efflux pump MntP
MRASIFRSVLDKAAASFVLAIPGTLLGMKCGQIIGNDPVAEVVGGIVGCAAGLLFGLAMVAGLAGVSQVGCCCCGSGSNQDIRPEL